MLQGFLSFLLLLPPLLVWPSPVSCTVQLQPITSLAGWRSANGSSWVFNGPRTVAAAVAAQGRDIYVLHHSNGSWLLADVLTPPDPELAGFVPGSVRLSDDGRLLAVAAAYTQASQIAQLQQLTAGYVFKVVAQPHTSSAFRYQLAGRLALPVGGSSGNDSMPSSPVAHVDMAADGQTLLACWVQAGGGSQGDGQLAAAAQLGGGAAVFSWRGYGSSLQAVQLARPQGAVSFGQSCQLSSEGRVALVLDGSRGAMVYSREAHTPRRSTPAYRAAGWLPGAPAQQHYRVAAASLSSDGRQAVLLVQGWAGHPAGAAGDGSLTAAKVFATDGFGQWGEACSIQLRPAATNQGAVRLTAHSEGVHVWAQLDDSQVMYAVGLHGRQAIHCPSQPVMTSLPEFVSDATHVATATASHHSPASTTTTIHRGRLQVKGPEAVYMAVE